MHELSLSSAILNTAVKHAAGRRVTLVNVRVGRLRQVVGASLCFYFQIVARDTVCEHARLELDAIEARLRCDSCGREWELELPVFRCPGCGTAEVAVVSGDEFEVESIEVEEAVCTAPG